MARRPAGRTPSLFDAPELDQPPPPPGGFPDAFAVHEAAQSRYLDYALSVIIAATLQARGMLCQASEVNNLSGPSRGVILIKLKQKEDRVLGLLAAVSDRDILRVETSRGAEQTISTAKYEVTGRGGKGRELLQPCQFVRIAPNQLEAPGPLEPS